MAIQNLSEAAGGNLALRKALESLDSRLTDVTPTPVSTTGSTTPAPAVTSQLINIVGRDGKFIIDVTTPQQYVAQKPVTIKKNFRDYDYYYESQIKPTYVKVQSSLNLAFDADGEVITFGPSSQSHFEDQRPNEIRYFRFSMSYDQTNWSTWTYFNDPTICGPAPVNSGFVRSIAMAPNAVGNTGNFATVDSIDNGVNATIRVYGPGGVGTTWTQQVGSTIFGPYPAALLVGYSYATNYTVMYDASANQFHVFTDAQYSDSLNDIYRFCGRLTTVGSGGGGGSTGGGGSGGGSGGCTEIGTPLYFDRASESVEVTLEENEDWIGLRFTADERPLMVHPDTLVGIWVRAKNLKGKELIDVGEDGEFLPLHSAEPIKKKSQKQKLKALPNRKYRAGSRKVELHNLKPIFE